MKLQRRHFLKLATATGTTCLVKPSSLLASELNASFPGGPFPVDPSLNYFSQRQREMFTVLAEVALPTSGSLGAARFVEQILSAFDFNPPRIYHDGTDFIPLNRYQEKAWRLRLFGSAGVGGGVNDSVLGVVTGLRDEVQAILDQAEKTFVGVVYPFTDALAASAWAALPVALQQRMVELTVQSTVGHPAYGGNLDRGGWKMIFFEGDSLPAGYSQYDSATKTNVERADAPLSKPNPGADPMPVSWITAAHLRFNQLKGSSNGGI